MIINKDLIKQAIKKKSLKQKDVAEKLGVGSQDFNNWMFRGVFPHFNKLEELADILDVNVSTLYTDDVIYEPQGSFNKRLSYPPEDLIPFHDLDPVLGLSALWNDNAELVPKDYAYLPGINADFIFQYYGKGMEPHLNNGDWIALRKVSDLSFFNYGNLHAVVTKEQFIVRDLKKSTKANTILLCSKSQTIDDITLPVKSIKVLFAVISIIKRNLI